MEDTIRKIMDNELMGDAGDSERCAKEIANNFERFMEWSINEQEVFFGELSEGYLLNDNPHPTPKTIQELFTYWNENVKDK